MNPTDLDRSAYQRLLTKRGTDVSFPIRNATAPDGITKYRLNRLVQLGWVARYADETVQVRQLCEWLALCEYPTTKTWPLPNKRDIPICDRCANKLATGV